jgi:hypothetical protein
MILIKFKFLSLKLKKLVEIFRKIEIIEILIKLSMLMNHKKIMLIILMHRIFENLIWEIKNKIIN